MITKEKMNHWLAAAEMGSPEWQKEQSQEQKGVKEGNHQK